MTDATSILSPETHPLRTHRELLSYLFVAALALAMVAFAIVLNQMISPRPELADLGPVGDLSASVPNPRAVLLRTSHRVGIWIVFSQGKWLAFDSYIRAGHWYCQYQWQPISQRFEDPCSGAKFSSSGQYLGDYLDDRESFFQDLDQYPVIINGDHLIVDVAQKIPGRPATPHHLPSMP